MLSTLPARARTSLAPTGGSSAAFGIGGLTDGAASSSLPSSAASSTSRLSTRSNVSSVRFLPRAPVASAFGGGLLGGAAGSSSWESSLNVVTGESSGGENSEVVLRTLRSTEQIAALEQQHKQEQLEAGGDAVAEAAAIDPAPILAQAQLKGHGPVQDLECLSDRLICAGMLSGEVIMLEITSGEQVTAGFGSSFGARATTRSSSNNLSIRPVHTYAASSVGAATSALAASLTSSTPLLASCSEDGSFQLIAPFQRQVVRTVKAHVSALHAAVFSSQTVLHTAGMGSQICGWDVRALSELGGSSIAKPSSLLTDCNAIAITSLTMHPTRPFNLAAGSSNGSVSIFDLRSSSRPLCTIQAQRSYVSDLAFVPYDPSVLVAASEDGSVCAFDFAPNASFAQEVSFTQAEVSSDKMKPSKLFQHSAGINSLAVDRDSRTILAGADAHSLIVLKNAV